MVCNWVLKKSFENQDLVKQYLSTGWAKRVENTCAGGKHVTFYCREHGKKCSAKCKLLFCSDSFQVEYYENEDFNHIQTDPKVLSAVLKEFIKELEIVGVSKPRQILAAIREKGMKEPPKSALSNYLARMRKQKCKSHIKLSDFSLWCIEHSAMPTDIDLPFVIAHDSEITENGIDYFHAVVSTRRLLKFIEHSSSIHIDSTYKLN